MKWIKTSDRLPKDGRYYVETQLKTGEKHKCMETIVDGQWRLFFPVIEVVRWLEENYEGMEEYLSSEAMRLLKEKNELLVDSINLSRIPKWVCDLFGANHEKP